VPLIQKLEIMAISSKDIETLWTRYQEDVSKRGISVARFFECNGVPYHTFEKWYKKRIAQPAVVDCVVRETPEVVSTVLLDDDVSETTVATGNIESKNISYVYVGFTDGMKIEHHKLSYTELLSFIQKIQPLCLV
jgi:hypothetical protein